MCYHVEHGAWGFLCVFVLLFLLLIFQTNSRDKFLPITLATSLYPCGRIRGPHSCKCCQERTMVGGAVVRGPAGHSWGVTLNLESFPICRGWAAGNLPAGWKMARQAGGRLKTGGQDFSSVGNKHSLWICLLKRLFIQLLACLLSYSGYGFNVWKLLGMFCNIGVEGNVSFIG